MTGKQMLAALALYQETQKLQDEHWKRSNLHPHLPCPDVSAMTLPELLLRRRELLGLAQPGEKATSRPLSGGNGMVSVSATALACVLGYLADEPKRPDLVSAALDEVRLGMSLGNLRNCAQAVTSQAQTLNPEGDSGQTPKQNAEAKKG